MSEQVNLKTWKPVKHVQHYTCYPLYSKLTAVMYNITGSSPGGRLLTQVERGLNSTANSTYRMQYHYGSELSKNSSKDSCWQFALSHAGVAHHCNGNIFKLLMKHCSILSYVGNAVVTDFQHELLRRN